MELRPSQIKINYDPTKALDPAMCIVDVLKTSHMRTPIRISSEVIINLAENGVPHKVFVELLRKGLQEQVEGLTTWDGPEAMFDLWCAVSRAEGVMSARLAREAAGEARARGHSSREADEDNDFDADDDIEDLDAAKSTAWWGDEISGCPSSLAETVMYLLDSGFTPSNCAVLREKLGFVIKSTINNYVLRYRLDVPMSCSAWLIPGMIFSWLSQFYCADPVTEQIPSVCLVQTKCTVKALVESFELMKGWKPILSKAISWFVFSRGFM